jgi:hypothetical protein
MGAREGKQEAESRELGEHLEEQGEEVVLL